MAHINISEIKKELDSYVKRNNELMSLYKNNTDKLNRIMEKLHTIKDVWLENNLKLFIDFNTENNTIKIGLKEVSTGNFRSFLFSKEDINKIRDFIDNNYEVY